MSLASSMLELTGASRGTPGSGNNHDDRPREINRYMGGHRRANHPYVNGYWYLMIEPPQFLFDNGSNEAFYDAVDEGGSAEGNTNSVRAFEASRWLHSTAEGFTPPTRTLTKVDVPGMGGMGSSFVAGQQLTRTFSTTHREYQNTTVFNTINLWTSVMDHHYGLSPMNGKQYIPANYKGSAYVFLCKPTTSGGSAGASGAFEGEPKIGAIDVDQFYFFEGVFPEGSPFDAFNSDINTNDVVQLNVTWSFDGWPYGREHKTHFERGISLLSSIYEYDLFGNYDGHVGNNASTLNTPIKFDSTIED
jgi:hypothetical protein